MIDLSGQSLGRYHILERLGEGGMAIVYKGYDTRLETDVAVKVIRTEKLTEENKENTLKRFEREAKSLARLTHANIVKVTDYGEYEEKPYLVMEFLPSGTLKDKMGKPIPWQDGVRSLIPIARALEYAHKQGMIHRDVKPSNILVTQSGDPMLTDFGIAKIMDEHVTLDLTGTNAMVGTPEYMAPEQVVSKNVDYRVDIYALGVVLYEMVTGRRPFTADTPMAVLFKQASEPLPRPKSYVPNLPDIVEKILVKALAKNPDDRYQSMTEFVAALEGLATDKMRYRVAPEIEKAPLTPASTNEKPNKNTPSRKIDARVYGLIAILLIAGLLFGGGIVLWQMRGSATPEQTVDATITPKPAFTNTTLPSRTATATPSSQKITPKSIILFYTIMKEYLRAGPDINHPGISGSYQKGTQMQVLGMYVTSSNERWFYIQAPDGKQGWFYQAWLEFDSSILKDIPVISDIPTPLPATPRYNKLGTPIP